jgi:hypothetical protein
LSLTEAISRSERDPNISAVSENDERVFGDEYYTSPTEFPPLEIHFSGQNGLSSLSSKNNHSHRPVACCRECVVSTAQDNSRGEGIAAQVNSAALFPATENNSLQPEDNSDKSTNEGGDQRAVLRMFTGVPA